YNDIVILLRQHYPDVAFVPPTTDDVNATIHEPNQHQFVAKYEGVIIAIALLIVNRKYTRKVGHIEEDVVLDGSAKEFVRKIMMENVKKFAANGGIVVLDLETSDDRTIDIAAYEKLGFTKRDNMVVYRWRL
ncbi:MAG: hypothetical protein UY74_C0040G0001, partial [Candidatus Kaiserbacteria bacterium GW2011_GWC2_52_8b]